MWQYILPHLAVHKQLSLQGIGTFVVTEASPQWQPVAQQFTPPVTTVSFTNEAATTSNEFVNYIANQTNKFGSNATAYINEGIAATQHNNTVVIDELGTLQQHNGQFSFEAQSLAYLLPIAAPKVIRPEATHTIRVGEQEKTNVEMQQFYDSTPIVNKFTWWHTALIISLFAIAYVVYYFSTNH